MTLEINENTAKIFEAAVDIVYDKGLAGLTMAEIGEVSGLGMGSIYNLFDSKEAIINAAYQHMKLRHMSDIYEGQEVGDPFMINFKRLFMAYFTDLWEHEKEHHFFVQCNYSHYLDRDSRGSIVFSLAKANELLEQGKKELVIKFLDNKVMISFMLGAIKNVIAEMKLYELPLDQKLVNDVFEMCRDSIKK